MKKVALIYGGDSSESEISVLSGKNISAHIDRKKYNVYEILLKGGDWNVQLEDGRSFPIDKSDFSFLLPVEDSRAQNRINFDIALIMIHGTPGENGMLQAYLEMVGMPHTTSPSIVSAITFNKYATKCFLRDLNIPMAKDIFIRQGEKWNAAEIISKLGLPLFVKPNEGGSSFGITKVKKIDELDKAVNHALEEDSSVLLEEFIEGREMTNGVFEINGEFSRLPVTEIISKNEFFDYEAKYLGACNEVCPAEISNSLSERIIEQGHRIYHHLGCKGVVRMDYIVRGDEIFFLEINTVPGMTEMSLVPQEIKAAGMTLGNFISKLLG
ncbi:MAG TPA: D-alanine--D-alanine ligase [Bacteroidales bacterium]|nr:D-alanine--D-alanine ligase [Bacteroidales bacterium]HRT33633.1 D-alanine--D-alanine ligase [Bacteroidales bacterium]HRT84146.1 D-alanine--D-alanine ligase [Bacteroidales bacterium]